MKEFSAHFAGNLTTEINGNDVLLLPLAFLSKEPPNRFSGNLQASKTMVICIGPGDELLSFQQTSNILIDLSISSAERFFIRSALFTASSTLLVDVTCSMLLIVTRVYSCQLVWMKG
jgi:hypothetical protein